VGWSCIPRKRRSFYCKDDNRREDTEPQSFTFLGYTFRPRLIKRKDGKLFVGLVPAMSPKAAKAVRKSSGAGTWQKVEHVLSQAVAKFMNPAIRGWVNYYGRFHRSSVSRF